MKSTNMFVTEHMNAHKNLTAAVIGFCRFLRRQSFRVGVAETLAALEACRVGPLHQRSYLRAALRALLCSSRQENEQFDSFFDQILVSGQSWGDLGRRRGALGRSWGRLGRS